MQPVLSDIPKFQKHTPAMVFRDQRSGLTSGTSFLPATALERGLDVSATARQLSRAPNLVLRTSRERSKCSIDRTAALLATIQHKAALFRNSDEAKSCHVRKKGDDWGEYHRVGQTILTVTSQGSQRKDDRRSCCMKSTKK
jgi:hypothetical protein